MIRCLLLAMSLGIAGFVLSLLPANADGCAAVRRSDRHDPPIIITEEGALIVWDSVNKVEHFIRRAAFDTPSPDFAFLVPTPGPDIPTLKEMEDAVFGSLDQWIRPRVVDKPRLSFEPMMCCFTLPTKGIRAGKADMEAKSSVRILGEQKVGGFETAILEADRTDELSDWLKNNGYSNDPELQSWLVPYVVNNWKITAFKIMQNAKTGQLATTKPVRMSFKTDKPFFPYREPENKMPPSAKKPEEKKDGEKHETSDARGPLGRMLRVFFISNQRMEGTLGNLAWHARVKWSDQLTDEQRQQIVAYTGLPENELAAKAWLTTFEDGAAPRPGKEEVYFVPSEDQTPIRPPDFIRFYEVWIPGDCLFVGVGLAAAVAIVIVIKRRRRQTA